MRSDFRPDSATPHWLPLIDKILLVISRALPWLLAILALTVLRDVLLQLTRTDSTPHAWVRLMSDVSRTRAFAFVFGILGALYGIRQRELRRRAVKRLEMRMASLERSAPDQST